MSMNIDVFTVIPVELTKEVIEQMVVNGQQLGFVYSNLGIGQKEKFKKNDISSLVDHLYNESQHISPKTYHAWVSGGVPGKSGFFWGFARGGETHFSLEKNEFEIRFGEGNALYKHDFLHNNFYTDLGWYTQTVLDLTKGLPIKQLHTLLR